MPTFDLNDLVESRLAELEALRISPTARPDFSDFWQSQIDQCDRLPLELAMQSVQSPFPGARVFDATFEGLDHTKINTWILLPREAEQGSVPVIVHFHGSGSSRGYPYQYAKWLLAGYGVIAMDFRMQGGMTGSLTGFSGGHWPLDDVHMGLESPENSYFRHVWTDAIRCIAVVACVSGMDALRIVLQGDSQGGATALAMASLVPKVAACLADVPSNCWIDRRVIDHSGGVGGNAAEYLRFHPDQLDRICTNISYFDNLNLVDRIQCPVLVSCGLRDPICPPHNVYAVYNRITAPKEICPYPFGEHDGGGCYHEVLQMKWLEIRVPAFAHES